MYDKQLKSTYLKYLSAAFGSALITSIYSLVDMAMVGQYQGPQGTAALAVVAPIWNVIYSLGLLTGIGGAVMFTAAKARGDKTRADGYVTMAVLASVGLAAVAWLALLLFQRPILQAFGADEALLPLAERYLQPIRVVFPLFLFNQMLAALLRNDHNPGLATAGVLAGGIANVFGDYFFVFVLDMGIYGAGLATALGACLSFLVMLTHLFSAKNTLRLVRPQGVKQLLEVVVTGGSTFFADVAMGILTVLFNRQIMKYLGGDALAVYGPIVNVSTFVQCCAYAVGQASQPLLSEGYGAGQWDRIRRVMGYALVSVAAFGVFWTGLSLVAPNLYVYLFMQPTQEILHIAPAMIRAYSLSFLLLPLNVFSTYYFQSMMRPGTAMGVSVARGCLVSGGLILILPVMAGPGAIWYAMAITELVVAGYAGAQMLRQRQAMPREIPC